MERYRIKRWTAFEWPDELTSDQRDHMLRAASVVHDRLDGMCPRLLPSCSMVQVGGQLQFVFTFNVEADSEAEAGRLVVYWVDRSMAGTIPLPRRGHPRGGIKLTPSWRKLEIRRVKVAA